MIRQVRAVGDINRLISQKKDYLHHPYREMFG